MTIETFEDPGLRAEIERASPILDRRRKPRGNPERAAQRAVIEWLRLAIPGCIVAASVNEQVGSSADPIKRARFGQARKASGVVTGWPDLTVALPGGRTVYVEMKSAKGRTSEAQDALHGRLRGLGHTVIVARDIDSARLGLVEAGVIR